MWKLAFPVLFKYLTVFSITVWERVKTEVYEGGVRSQIWLFWAYLPPSPSPGKCLSHL